MRSASRSRVAAAVLAVPALVLGVAACGPAEHTGAVAAHSGAGSQSSRWDEKTLVPAMRSAIEKQKSVHVAVRATGSSTPMNAVGDVALGRGRPDLAFEAEKTPFGGPAEIRVVKGVVYLSMPPMTPHGKFLEIRPGARSGQYGGMMGPMHGNPAEGFAAFRSGLRKVTYVGQETVDGERLAHYRVTVDPRAAARKGGVPYGEDMPHGYGRSHMGRVSRSVTFDLWLDNNALPHRVALHEAPRGSLVVDLADWGKPVTVQAPPRNDIVQHGRGQWPGMSRHSRW